MGSGGSGSLPTRTAILTRRRCRALKPCKIASHRGKDSLGDTKDKDEEKNEPLRVIGAERNSQALHLYYRPRIRAASPFQPASEQDDWRLQSLIHHYTRVVSIETVTPVGPRHEWFPFAVVDEALFHAVMSHTAAHLAYLQRVPIQNEAHYYWHTGRAIRLVNERLKEGIVKASTEGTICAVCALTQQQAFSAQVEGTKMHLNGLIQLVNAAGGIESIQMNPKTRRYVLLTDLATSITLNKPFYLRPSPLLCYPDLAIYFGPATLNTEYYARTFSTRLYNFTENAPLSRQAFNVYWGLRNLNIMLENIRAGRDSPDTQNANDLQFTDRVEVLERAAHGLWFQDIETNRVSSPSFKAGPAFVSPILKNPTPSTSSTHHSSSTSPSESTSPPTSHHIASDFAPLRLLGHATLIHIYLTLRQLPPQLQMQQLIATRIHTLLIQLSKSTLNMLLATFPDLMIWVMVLAGSVALEQRQKLWFARCVASVLAVRERSVGVGAGRRAEEGGLGGQALPAGLSQEKEERSEVQRAATRFLWPEEVVLDPCE